MVLVLKLLDKIQGWLAVESFLPVRLRVFRLACIAGVLSSICLTSGGLVWYAHTIWEVKLLSVLIGIFSGVCYVFSLHGRHYIQGFLIIEVLLLDFCWLLHGGLSGGVTFYYFPLLLLPLALCRGANRFFLALFVGINLLAVLVFSHLVPRSVLPIVDLNFALADTLIGVLVCLLGTGTILWLITSGFDRKALKQRNYGRQLIASSSNYKGVVENATCIIMKLSPEGNILFINRFGEELLGYTRAELVGQPFMETFLVQQDNLQKARWSWLNVESEYVNKHGKHLWLTWINKPVQGADRKLKEILCVGADMTDVHKYETHMQDIQRLESLGVVAGGIAHDFNNRLTAVIGNIALAATRLGESPEKRFLEEAEQVALSAKDLTSQLLTFAKGGQPIKKLASIHTLVLECVDMALHGRNVRCDLNLQGDAWVVNGDVTQLRQAINNIIINACEAMLEGGVIKVGLHNVMVADLLRDEPAPMVEITIQDFGCGIAKDQLGRVFDPYFTTKPNSSGLGLSVAYSIVKNHNGLVLVDSQLKAGSKFTIKLPALPNAVVPIKSEPELPTNKPLARPARILILDDEDFILQLLHVVLSDAGYLVTITNKGASAIEKVNDSLQHGTPFDLLIMDLTLPGEAGGHVTLQEIKKIYPTVRALVSSGYADDPVLSEFEHYGFIGSIPKPYTREQMLKTVSYYLAHNS